MQEQKPDLRLNRSAVHMFWFAAVMFLVIAFVAHGAAGDDDGKEPKSKPKVHKKKHEKKHGKRHDKKEEHHKKAKRKHHDDDDDDDDDDGGNQPPTVPPTVPPPIDPLAVENALRFPTRICEGPGGKIYVTDVKVGSVFIHDPTLKVVGELKGLLQPLGVAVASNGNIFVGCDGSDSVEIFDSKGNKVGSIANLAMPNDLAFDRDGNLYAVDSKANAVAVYDPTGQWLRTVGLPLGTYAGLFFPSAVTVAYRADATAPTGEVGEIYVADQNHATIQVFDLQGNPLRVLAGPMSDFSSDWQGKFVRPQSVRLDSSGRLHVLDAYLGKVQILDPVTGGYLAAYAAFDADAERLKVPLDLLLAADGRAIVTNSETRTLEVFATLPN